MKKILVLVIALMIIITPVLAEDSPTFTNMTDEELMQLYIAVSNELVSRNRLGGENRIGRGEYVVGQHIKAGTYDFVCVETDRNGESPYNHIIIRQLDDSGKSIGVPLSQISYTDVGGHVTLILEEGTRLDIDGCSGELFEMTASWIP